MTVHDQHAPAAPGTVRPVSPLTPADDWMGITYGDMGALEQQAFLRPTGYCLLDASTVSAGVLPVLCDAALGWVSLHATAPDRFIVTSNMHVDVFASVRPESTLTVRDARVLAVDEYGVTCGADLVDVTRDVVVAATTARFAVVPLGSRNAGSVIMTDDTSDEPSDAGVLEEIVPVGPDAVSRMFQLGLASHDGKVLEFVAGASPELANDRGGLHGGVAAMLGQHVALATLGVVRPDVPYRCVEMRAVYLRPVPARGGVVRCVARVLHAGRRQAVVTTSVLDSLGNVAVEVGAVFST